MPKKSPNLIYFEAVGRRKSAVARVRLYLATKEKSVSIEGNKIKTGDILVNKKPMIEFFTLRTQQTRFFKPLDLSDSKDRFAISILVKGGGKRGQLDAIVHGLTRAIAKSDTEKFRPLFKKEGMFTRDARIRERRKVGKGGKARRQKQSPKR